LSVKFFKSLQAIYFLYSVYESVMKITRMLDKALPDGCPTESQHGSAYTAYTVAI